MLSRERVHIFGLSYIGFVFKILHLSICNTYANTYYVLADSTEITKK